MSVNIKVTGGLNIEWGQIDPTATGGLKSWKSHGNPLVKMCKNPGVDSSWLHNQDML